MWISWCKAQNPPFFPYFLKALEAFNSPSSIWTFRFWALERRVGSNPILALDIEEKITKSASFPSQMEMCPGHLEAGGRGQVTYEAH